MTWIQTFTGKKFDFINPCTEDVCIEDIAHALSLICRFGGHTKRHYSVAQHSVCISYYVSSENALEGLLHDAAEAYIGDVCKPLKKMLPDYQKIEMRISAIIFAKFGISEIPKEVSDFDLRILASEARDLLPGGPIKRWAEGIIPLYDAQTPIRSSIEAMEMFIRRYEMVRRF